MVSGVPHNTDKSAIHTRILYVKMRVFTIELLGVFRILDVSLKIYLRGVKCGRILMHLVLDFSPEYPLWRCHAVTGGVLSEKSG